MSGFISGLANSVTGSDLLKLGTTLYGYNKLKSNAPSIPYQDFNSSLKTVDPNRSFSTGYSSLQGGNAIFDPSIRSAQDYALGNAQTMFGDLKGNMNPYVTARVSPLKEAYALRRGELTRGLGRRGVFGSFANQDLTSLDTTANREIGNAGSLATQESLNSQRGVNQDITNIAQQKFSQELQGLGLGANSIAQLLQIAMGLSGNTMQGALSASGQDANASQNQLSLIGRGLASLSSSPFLASGGTDAAAGTPNGLLSRPLSSFFSSPTLTGSAAAAEMAGASGSIPGWYAAGATPAVTSGGAYTTALGGATPTGLSTGGAPSMATLAGPLALVGVGKFIDSLRGGSVESAKSGKLGSQLQKDMQADPTGQKAQQTINNLLTNKLWPNEGNQWVVNDLIKSGTLDLSTPALYGKDSVFDTFNWKPSISDPKGMGIEAYAKSANSTPQQTAELTKLWNDLTFARNKAVEADRGDTDPSRANSKLEQAKSAFDSYLAKMEPQRKANAQNIYTSLINSGYTGDLSKLETYLGVK